MLQNNSVTNIQALEVTLEFTESLSHNIVNDTINVDT